MAGASPQSRDFLDEYLVVLSKIGAGIRNERTSGIAELKRTPSLGDIPAADFLDDLVATISFKWQAPVFALLVQKLPEVQFLIATNSNYRALQSDKRCSLIMGHLRDILDLLNRARLLVLQLPQPEGVLLPGPAWDIMMRTLHLCWGKFYDRLNLKDAHNGTVFLKRAELMQQVLTTLHNDFKGNKIPTQDLRSAPAGFASIAHVHFLRSLRAAWRRLVAASKVIGPSHPKDHVAFSSAPEKRVQQIKNVLGRLVEVLRCLFTGCQTSDLHRVADLLQFYDTLINLPAVTRGRPFLFSRHILKVLDFNLRAFKLLRFSTEPAFAELVGLIGTDSSDALLSDAFAQPIIQGTPRDGQFAPHVDDPEFLKDANLSLRKAHDLTEEEATRWLTQIMDLFKDSTIGAHGDAPNVHCECALDQRLRAMNLSGAHLWQQYIGLTKLSCPPCSTLLSVMRDVPVDDEKNLELVLVTRGTHETALVPWSLPDVSGETARTSIRQTFCERIKKMFVERAHAIINPPGVPTGRPRSLSSSTIASVDEPLYPYTLNFGEEQLSEDPE
ncbi:hypothetical protein AURDEDRAFT_166827 [Auricularia subglabra TFB-10046 SS5]|nr:hypothetical protein AURDEDRAFT_166827 [Auricularia subglabra TFB-10046 SS5]